MRIARVIGNVTLHRRIEELRVGRLLLVETLDGQALAAWPEARRRDKPMPESLVVFDQLGAGVGQLIALSEGREAAMPFHPERVAIDAYCAAILDELHIDAALAAGELLAT